MGILVTQYLILDAAGSAAHAANAVNQYSTVGAASFSHNDPFDGQFRSIAPLRSA